MRPAFVAFKRRRISETPSWIVAGTVVNGDIDPRTLQGALEALPRQPERIIVVESESLPLGHEKQLRDLDAFVRIGRSVIYLRRQSPTLLAAEFSGGPYLLMLAAIIWHEMAHTEGLDERHARSGKRTSGEGSCNADLWTAASG